MFTEGQRAHFHELGKELTMPRVTFSACLLAFFLLTIPRAFAVASPPKPREDVTKLEKPTISYVTTDTYEIRLLDLDGTNDRLWMSDGKARFPVGVVWSPDGKRAATVVFDGSDWSYTPYVLELETGRVQNLLEWLPPDKGIYNTPAWSPDGNWLALRASRDIDIDIYKVNVHNGRFQRLTSIPRRMPYDPTWSPNGRIAFRALVKPYEVGVPNDVEIYAMNADGSNIVNLTNHPKWDESPSWSPDGKKIVFRSYRLDIDVPKVVGKAELYMMNPDGSGLERLTYNRGTEAYVTWSPNSQWIVYKAGPVEPDDPTPFGLYRMRVATKERFLIKYMEGYSTEWVLAGKSRFLSVDPAGKKHAQWGEIKEAEEPQERNSP